MLNIYQLNTAEAIQKYKNILQSINVIEPYGRPEYIEVFSGGLDNLYYFLFISTNQKDKVVMPGYLKPVVIGEEKTGYFDFITPYGYTGPFFSNDISENGINEFWRAIDQWYLENDVVAEFIRFDLFGNEKYYSGEVFPTMLNIKGRIVQKEMQWTNFDHKVRKNVNKGIREGLISEVYYQKIMDDKIEEFHEIYIDTMIRTNARQNFHYTLDQFKRFIKNNSDFAAICTVYLGSKPISSELLLVSNEAIYSFLGGTLNEFFDKRPNDFLKMEAINWARNHSKKYYILGGGYGFEDGIFKYKKAFFPNDIVKYCTGRKIINPKVYQSLIDKNNVLRLSLGLEKLSMDDTSFFPLYNKIN